MNRTLISTALGAHTRECYVVKAWLKTKWFVEWCVYWPTWLIPLMMQPRKSENKEFVCTESLGPPDAHGTPSHPTNTKMG